MSTNLTKEYTNGEITVVWKPGTCIHSEKCWRGLHSVFQPKSRPWIDMEGASTEEIKAQVDRCPSGALTWYANADGKPGSTPTGVVTKVDVTQDGPVLVHGDIEVSLPNGGKETRQKTTAFCRCGMSANKPYCDGSHKREGWKAE